MQDDTIVIDFISTNKDTKDVTLTIADAYDWKDEAEHLFLMQDKIHTYLAFIETGQSYEIYPNAKGQKIVIALFAKCSLPEIAVAFLEKVNEFVTNAGYEFCYKVTG